VEGFSRFASSGLVTAIVSSVTVAGSLVVMTVISPLLAAIVVATVLPFVVLLRRYNARIAAAYVNAREYVAEANARLQENLAGVRETQALGQQTRRQAEFQAVIRSYLAHRLAAEKLAVATYPIVSFLNGLALSIVLGVGAYRLAQGQLSAGDLIAVTLCMSVFFQPIIDIAIFITSDLKRVRVSTSRIGELMQQEPERRDSAQRGQIAGDLRLVGVRFTYPGTDVEVLHGVDLTVPAGSTVALVGPTGAGKSTVLKLMAGFHDVSAGQVLIDGIDSRTVDPALIRSWVGYLPQEPYLFAGTVRDNIAYGRPEATQAEVEKAAADVGAHELILALPGGYDHPVGERGAALSAGLRQLVCLARAYLVQPAIVLLDEATAKLDLATEARIMAAVGTLTAGRTTVIVAHRLQTAMSADRIVVIDDGRVAEQGTHDELLAAGGHYAALYAASIGVARAEPEPAVAPR
jgi:ATP-binding cassette subfamily B protein